MKIDVEDQDKLTIISVEGDLMAEQVDRFRRLSLERLDGPTRDFVLDLEEADFIDSNGLEAIVWLQDSCAERLGQVRLSGCSEQVRQILHVTRLDLRLDQHDTVDAAVHSLR